MVDGQGAGRVKMETFRKFHADADALIGPLQLFSLNASSAVPAKP
ncbi:hypothetical protein BBFGKLBO_01553 [Synechococcus sp. CBW1107]|nr:hypothetical protein BBFGKLBO_01553 [Synechococcus sp. CBW1107]